MNLEQQLQELKDENEALKQQLQGPDLKAFEQIRELRSLNAKLTEDVKRVTGECVQLNFRGKQSEKEKEKLAQEIVAAKEHARLLDEEIASCRQEISQRDGQLSDLRGKLEQAESTIAEGQRQKSDLEHSIEGLQGELESNRSLVLSHEQELARQRQELSERLQTLESLQTELGQRETRIGNLEKLVNDFKEQYLSGEFITSTAGQTSMDSDSSQGGPYSVMVKHLSQLFGVAGSAIVDQVYELTGTAQSSTDSSAVELVYESLQDAAQTYANGTEHEAALPHTLELCWAELLNSGLVTSSSAPSVAAASPAYSAPSQEPTSELVSAAVAEPEIEESVEPTAVVENAAVAVDDSLELSVAETSPEEVAEEPSEAVSAPDSETELEASHHPEAVSAPELDDASPAQDSAQTQDESEPEAEVDTEPPVEHASEESAENPADLLEALAFAISEPETDAEAETQPLAEETPDQTESTVAAVEISVPQTESESEPETQEQPDSEEAGQTSSIPAGDSGDGWRHKLAVLEECRQQLTAQPHDSDALQLLQEQLGNETWTGHEAEFEIFVARTSSEQEEGLSALVEALNGTEVCDFFELLESVTASDSPIKNVSDFLALAADAPREDILANESKFGLDGKGANRELVEEISADPETEVVEKLLETLYSNSALKLPLPGPSFTERTDDASPAAFVGTLRQALRMVDYTIFDFEQLDVLSYDGDDLFLVDGSLEPKLTLLFSSDLDNIPAEELRFLAFRKLAQLFLRSRTLEQLAESFDESTRKTLIEALFEALQEDGVENLELHLDAVTSCDGSEQSSFDVLRDLYASSHVEMVADLADWMVGNRLTEMRLDEIADRFAIKVCGLGHATYATVREYLLDQPDLFERVSQEGFRFIFQEADPEMAELRIRLQRLWRAAISEHLPH